MSQLSTSPAIFPNEQIVTDDLDLLLDALPKRIVEQLQSTERRNELLEVVMDLGRLPEARYPGREIVLSHEEVTEVDLQFVIDRIGDFGEDNRAGIERTLHRISCIRNRRGKIVGLTCRVGRAVYGTIRVIEDLVLSGKSILFLGKPGVGKTTMLREVARVLADDANKRVIIVDTSNEIGGDGDVPHPAIGGARRMQVPTPAAQHAVMIEAVENHMPEVIVIDEIGTELEAAAARTIAERGVQLVGTAHGNTLENLMMNPTLSDLIGGIQSVTLSDEEARRRGTQKSILERKAPPTFTMMVEIQARDRVAVYRDVAETIDAMLRGDQVSPELRWRDDEGVHRSQSRPRPSPREQLQPDRFSGLIGSGGGWRTEPGWRGDSGFRGGSAGGGYLPGDRGGARPGFRPGASGSWRPGRSPSGSLAAVAGGAGAAPGSRGEPPFVAGDIADRGPLERGTAPAPETRAREARELARQREWRDSAAKAIDALKADEGTGPVNVADLAADDEALMDRAIGAEADENGAALYVPEADSLPTLRVLPQGISRKRLEQAIRELQLPVIVARDVDEADVVMTIRSEYKQKTPMVREAEERALPIYVLKTNTIPQMQSSLTSIFALEIDPRDAALRETEDAIGLVINRAEAVELSPQNAYIRRLQHQMAERANLVSRSRGREPYRRVRLYPDPAKSPWR